jgi:hypothetical protein
MAQEPISREKLDKLFKLFEGGVLLKDISKETGICDDTISKYLNQKYPNGKRRKIALKNIKSNGFPIGENRWNWKGGREITRAGYMRIWLHEDGRRIRVLEHRHVMEQFLGRKLLKKESVHHINGNKLDNRIENLKVIEKGEHTRLHNRNMKIIRNRKGQFKTVILK